jgi:hypothetical protein
MPSQGADRVASTKDYQRSFVASAANWMPKGDPAIGNTPDGMTK